MANRPTVGRVAVGVLMAAALGVSAPSSRELRGQPAVERAPIRVVKTSAHRVAALHTPPLGKVPNALRKIGVRHDEDEGADGPVPAPDALQAMRRGWTRGSERVHPASGTVAGPLWTPVDASSLDGPDPMAAVGKTMVVVTDAGGVAFFDRVSGEKLLHVGAGDLFTPFLSPTNPDGSPNPSYIGVTHNTPADVPDACNAADGPTSPSSTDGIINQAYDVRVHYLPAHGRFLVLAAARNACWRRDDVCRALCVREVMWAISASEHPADGFAIYRTGVNNYRDWPRVTIDGDFMVLAHNGWGDEGTPIITVYSVPDMIAGKMELRAFQVFSNGIRSVIPVHNTAGAGSRLFFLERTDGAGHSDRVGHGVRVWYVIVPASPAAIFDQPPLFLFPAGDFNLPGSTAFRGGSIGGATYAHGRLWLAGKGPADNGGYGVLLVQLPIKTTGPTSTVSFSIPDGYRIDFYDDERYDYQHPALAVNPAGDMAFGFLRYPKGASIGEGSQLRVKLHEHGQAEARASVLAVGWPGADRPEKIDFAWAAHDPSSPSTFWVSHRVMKPDGTSSVWVGPYDPRPAAIPALVDPRLDVRRVSAATSRGALLDPIHLVDGPSTGQGPVGRLFGVGNRWSYDAARTSQDLVAPANGVGTGVLKSTSAIAASSDGQRLSVFGLGTDDRVWRARSSNGGRTWPGNWSRGGLDATAFGSAPAVAASRDGQTVHLFAVGKDDSFLYYARSRDGGATWPGGWRVIHQGAVFSSAPGATTSADGTRVHVAARGMDHRVWRTRSLDGGDTWPEPWTRQGTDQRLFASAPALALAADGSRLQLAALGYDRRIWHATSIDGGSTWGQQSAAAGPWAAIGTGTFSSGPTLAASATGTRVYAFARGWLAATGLAATPKIYRAMSSDGGRTWALAWRSIEPRAIVR